MTHAPGPHAPGSDPPGRGGGNLPRVLAIVVTWEKRDYVLALLRSLAGIEYDRDRLDVLVVDNASTDDTVARIRAEFPGVRILVNPENLGGTGGFNAGLAYARERPEYDLLWLLDNDVVVNRFALLELVRALGANPRVGIAGSAMFQLEFPWRLNELGGFIDLCTGQLHFLRHGEEFRELRGASVEELAARRLPMETCFVPDDRLPLVDYVAAASMLVRAPLARELGGWKDFFLHFDDVEWCLRAARRGHEVRAVARSVVWHLSAGSKAQTWVHYYDVRNCLATVAEHLPGAVPGVAEKFLGDAIRFATTGRGHLAGYLLDGVRDYLAGRFGKRVLAPCVEYRSRVRLKEALEALGCRSLLVSDMVNVHLDGMDAQLAELERAGVRVEVMTPPSQRRLKLPRQRSVDTPAGPWQKLRWLLPRALGRGRYDALIQDERHPFRTGGLLAHHVVTVVGREFCVDRPSLRQGLEVLAAGRALRAQGRRQGWRPA